jgi:NADPH:quinone reductase-like Zn-dependent oxidoreductase
LRPQLRPLPARIRGTANAAAAALQRTLSWTGQLRALHSASQVATARTRALFREAVTRGARGDQREAGVGAELHARFGNVLREPARLFGGRELRVPGEPIVRGEIAQLPWRAAPREITRARVECERQRSDVFRDQRALFGSKQAQRHIGFAARHVERAIVGALRRRLGGPEDGVLAEWLCVHESAAVAVPAHLSDEEAATLAGAGVTAWQALYVLGRLCPGQHVLLQGTGSVSLFALQLARLGGAEVTLLSRSERKLAQARALGANHLLHTARLSEWPAEVLRITHDHGVDLVVDVLGGAQLNRSIAATRVGGTVVALGFLDGMTSSVDLPSAIRRSISIRTSSGRSRESFAAFMRALAVGELHPPVDRVFEFADARAAFESLARAEGFGKTVLRLSRAQRV